MIGIFIISLAARSVEAQIAPLSSYSNTQQSSATDGTNTDTFVAGASLANGVDHLVIYNAGYGGGGTSDEIGARIEFGSTVIGRSVDEGSSSGSPEAVRVHQLSGFYVVTGNGTDELRIKHEVVTGTSYIMGKGIIAIPLDSLTEDSDYWQSVHNADTNEITFAGTFINVRDATFNLPENGNYLVLASMEATMAAGSNSGGASMRFQMASTTQKMEWAKEWETNSMSQNFTYARIHTLSAGNNTFTLQGGLSQGSATAGFRRSRIIVIRASAFDQMISTTTDVQSATAATFEVSGAELGWDNWLTNTYTPNQTEYVVVIGNGFAWQGSNYRSTAARLENTTDGTVFSEFTSDDAHDINVGRITHLVSASEQISAAKTYALQMSNENSTTADSQRQFGDLIVWSMQLSGCVDNADCDDSNVCTSDLCSAGVCEYTQANEGLACDDGNACLIGETCQSGTCTGGSAPDCSGSGDQCNTASCDADGTEGNCDTVTPTNEGLSCDDGDACLVGETCQSGSCTGGTAPDCSGAGDQCNTASCDAGGAEGNCDTLTPTNEGLSCDDGDACLIGETCQSGSCTGGTVPDCSGSGDQCNTASCDAGGAEGNCDTLTPTNEGLSCDDGDACLVGETCQSGSCTGGTAPDCSGSGDQCNTASCDAGGAEGNCDTLTPTNEGLSCDDGDACLVGETCQSGSCTGGTAPDCSGSGDQCNTASCDAGGAEGNCDTLTPTNEGLSCDDGDACLVGETCQSGSCTGGTAPDCSGSGDQCNTASCDSGGAEGNCDTLTPTNEGLACDDGNACLIGETCQSGTCTGGSSPDCSGSGDQCNTASCDSGGAEGNCDTLTPTNEGLSCDDGDACLVGETCQSGSCTSGTAPDCSGAGDQCNTASCDSGGAEGNCDTLTPTNEGLACDDGDVCLIGETCQSGSCTGGAAPDCSGFGDQCNDASCDPAGTEGNCDTWTPANEGLSCDDGDACLTGETCQAGTCLGGSAPDCSGAGDQCNTASCDSGGAEGNCDIWTSANEGLSCDDGDVCLVGETCQSGSCTGGSAPDCSGSGDQCNDASCDPVGSEGNCDTVTPANEGLSCDDGDVCLIGETCQSGTCMGGSAPDCSGTGDQCNADSTCDPAGAEGNCDTAGGTINEGLACDDGDVCLVGETCQSGTCTGGIAPDCSGSGDQCNDASCDPAGAEGNCDTWTPANEGLSCDDGDVCLVGETCQSGSCTGGSAPDCSGSGDQCNDASCDPVGSEGNCDTVTPANEGLSCDDGDVCLIGETCQSGTCMGGSAPDCSGTGDQCNADSTCDPAGAEGNCGTAGGTINEGLACDDGDVCNVGETCQSGSCTGGGSPDCSGTGDQCNADDTCDAAGAEGNCDTPGGPINEGLACDDGDVCLVGETCQSGSCTGGGSPDCSGTGDQCNADDTCDPAGAEGNCDTPGGPINEGLACDDGLACNVGETCQSGSCTGGGAADCFGTGDQCNADSTCDPAGAEDNCDTAGGAINEGLACDDGDVCNIGETCQSGTCMGGIAPDCSGAGDQCNDASCDPAGAEGNCDTWTSANEGLACDDGLACNVGETCQAGICTGGGSQDCTGTGGQCITDSTCDPAGAEGNCDTPGTPINEGLSCDDVLFCTLTDTCSVGVCVGTGDTCPGQNCDEINDVCFDCFDAADCEDFNECTLDECIDGTCYNTPTNEGFACDDGDVCLIGETCQTGVCMGGSAPDCSGFGDQCNDASCDPAGSEGNCDTWTPANEGLSCDDGDVCLVGETCQSGTCTGGIAPDCSGSGDQCNDASCDPAGAEGNCDIWTLANEGLSCDDGDVCLIGETCQSGTCTGGSAPDCSGAGDQCNDASCDPAGAEGNCDTLTPVNEGLSCDDGDVCLIGETCQSGLCTGGAAPDCSGFDDQCNDASCDSAGSEGNCDTLTPANEGQSCDDGDVCLVGETCQSGTCMGGIAPDCSGSGDQCNDASCDSGGAEGNCDIWTPANEGLSCDDGDVCLIGETCQSGSCTGGTVPDCSGAGDQCTDASCDPAGSEGNCDTLTPVNEGLSCDDGDVCLIGETCQSGLCTGGTVPDCSGAGDQCNNASCDPAGTEGNCDTWTPANEGLSCDDGDVCLVGETCQSGTCTGGSAPDCSGSGDQCNDASCDPAGAEGNCDTWTPANEGLSCDDGDVCLVGETCQSGTCTGGSAPDCSGSGDQCNDASCDPAGAEGNCDIWTPANEGLSCDDGDVCLIGETCQAGTCTDGSAPDCSGVGDQCNDASCDSGGAEGNCDTFTPINEGLACDDSDVCLIGETCQSGSCIGGTVPDCSGAGDQCNDASCDSGGAEGNCDIWTPANEGLSCDDGDVCLVGETCQSGSCIGGSVPDCSGAGDQCNTASCDSGGVEGNCDTLTPTNEGLACDDAAACLIGETCQSGLCIGGTAPDCSGAGDQCNTASCDALGLEGNCDTLTPTNEGLACDDGDVCLVGETCQTGVCTGGAPPDCSAAGDQCNTASCDPVGLEGNCDTWTPINEGLACNDGNACLVGETCQSGSCTGSVAPDCSGAGDQCNDASCDSGGAEGNCDTLTPINEGLACDDGDACLVGETCQSGSCMGGAAPDCSGAGDQCNTASCDVAGAEGNCDTWTPINEGLACDDGAACNVGETCQSGSCTGGGVVDCTGTGDQCNADSTCDPAGAEGNCDTAGGAINEGLVCDEGDACLVGETCQSGSCTGGTAPDCSGAGDQCNTASCSAVGAEGNCDTLTPINEGLACDDGDVCLVGETCQAGTCMGGGAPDCSGTGDQCNADSTCDPAGTEGNCDTPGGAINEGLACDDEAPCTDATCQSGVCTFVNEAGQITVNLEIQGIGTVVTRDVTFVVTTCGGSTDIRTIPVSLDAAGLETVVLDQVDADAGWLAVREGHTLRRLAPLTFASCAATVDLTDSSKLLTGDFQVGVVTQDGLVDITDFSILAARFNVPIDASLSTGADATGDGVQGTADFTAMQPNFMVVGEALDACPVGSQSESGDLQVVGLDDSSVLPVIPRSAVSVASLRIPGAEAADLTGDGIVDAKDIRAFARLHGLPLLPEFEQKLRILENGKQRRHRR